MRTRIFSIGTALLFCCAAMALAQGQGNQQNRSGPHDQTSQVVPLTVPAGVPLDLMLENSVPIKYAGTPVRGQIVEPVYVFDHLVIPAGSQVTGRIAQVEGLSRKQRALAIANGDFTPLRKAQIDFDTLVLKDGKKVPLQTAVTEGAPSVVHLSAGDHGRKKGRVGGAVAQARQQAKSREQEAVKQITAPGKMQRLKTRLEAELPYRKQSFTAGTHFTAELKSPLDFGKVERKPGQLDHVGSAIPPGSTVHVRLLTSLSSAINQKGSRVQAVVSEPVFSPDHHLILPEGARLEGVVTQAVPARRLGRNGQLRFMFRKIDVGSGGPRNVEASLQGIEAPSAANLRLDSEGGAHAVTPKTKYIAPAIDVLLASSSLDDIDGRYHHGARAGLSRGPDVGGGAIRGAAGFGLVGTVIGLAAHYRPLSAGFAFYGAGMSVYSHVVARGNDVVFPRNTPMEIRFGTHEDPSKAPATRSHRTSNQKTSPVSSS